MPASIDTSYRFSFTDEQLECLKSKDIPFMKYSGRYIIEESHFHEVLGCLGAQNEGDYILNHTEADGLIDVRVQIRLERPSNVSVDQWDGTDDESYKDEMCVYAGALADQLRKHVVINVPHGRPIQSRSGISDTFNVHIWSTPEFAENTRREVEVPSHIFGNRVACRDNGFPATGIGAPINSGDYCVAEVFEDEMYIHHDICDENDSDSLQIFKKIMEQVVSARQQYIDSKTTEGHKVFLNGVSSAFYQNAKESIENENIPELFGKSIVLSDQSRQFTRNPLIGDNYLELCFSSSGSVGMVEFTGDKILGYKVQPSNKLIKHSGVFDIGLFNDSSDDIIAQVTGKQMQVLVHGILSKQKNFVSKLLLEYKRVLDMNEEEREAYDEKGREAVSSTSLNSFIEVLKGSRMNMLKEQKDKITEHQNNISKYQKDIIEMTRQLAQSMVSVEALEKDDGWIQKKVASEMNAMRKNKNILRIEIVGEKLHALTRVLFAKNPETGKIHEIGAFNITMELRRGGDMVNFRNLTRQVNAYEPGMQAPHVFPRGNACLGSIGDTLPSLIGNCEYSVALDLCVQFLQSVNTADVAGKHIEKWPLAETVEAK